MKNGTDEKKINLNYFLRNILVFCIAISSIYLFAINLKSTMFDLTFITVLFLITSTLLIRSLFLSYDDDKGNLWDLVKKITPPVFDNGYFLRHTFNEPFTNPSPSILNTQITYKLVHFILLYSFGIILNKLFFADISNTYNLISFNSLPNLELNSPQLLIQMNASRISLTISIFLKGLIFILNIMSLSLVVESAYLIFGYNIKEHFSYKFQSESFSQFFSQTMPMHSDLLKNVFIYPGFNFFIKYTKSRFIMYLGVFFIIFLIGFGINVIKFLSFKGNFDLGFGIYRIFLTDLISYLVISFSIILFKAKSHIGLFIKVVLNLLFIFLLGIVVYIRFKSLTVDLDDKLNLLIYAILGLRF